MIRIALLTRIVNADAPALARLAEAGVEVAVDLAGYDELMETPRGRALWKQLLPTLDGLVVGLQQIDAAMLDAAPRLRWILRIGTGLDSIDVPAAEARGVEVVALAGMNATAVAEFAFTLLLAASKHLPEIDASVRAGEWGRTIGRQLEGSTLGLVGFGPIARAMVPKARGFGMDVVVHRRTPDPADDAQYGVRSVPLDELVRTAPFLSIHAPLTDQTRGMIGTAQFDLMQGTILVNTSRGGLIDEAALIDALRSGKVAAAALDVLAEEPPAHGNPLIGMPHVLVTSHTAGHTDTVNASIAAAAAELPIA
jgi:phosphoglycerate dehydrogenase-like enzyme